MVPLSARHIPLTHLSLPQQAGRLCVALSGPEMMEAASVIPGERFFEFRLDSVDAPPSVLPALEVFLAQRPEVTAVATCRRRAYGGAYAGSAAEQMALLTRAAQSGCRLIDLEVETAEELGSGALDALREAGAAVIVSWHDFEGTPDLEQVLRRMRPFAPDFYKVVPTASSLRDSVRLIDLLEQNGADGRLIAMSMGFKGVLTRVLGPRFGSAFAFAAPDSGSATAPGQVSVSTMRELYRVDSITPATELYAVAGEPVTGSKSPLMHNTAFAAAGRDAVYLPLETTDVDELRDVVDKLQIRGVSITMPLKETALPLLSHADASVKQMKACNTLVRAADGILTGYNTDVAGVVGPLERQMPLQGKRVLVLGAGGAARAAVFGLRDAGAEVFILNRTVSRAEQLAAEAGVQVQPRETVCERRFDILINATPFGMRGQSFEAPLTAGEMCADVFFDLVYNPAVTPMMQWASERGIPVIPGLAMFAEQGARQFSLWTGTEAPREAMERAVADALQAEQT